ncbi:MAG: sarcosine oxidase subunit gamma family protein [Pseudomonadota bacterium]
MSNVTAINGASYKGVIEVKDAGLTGMITLRSDMKNRKLPAAVKAVTNLQVPAMREVKMGKKGAVAWMSPDELLMLCDYTEVDAKIAKLEAALKGTHFMAVNVSDARQIFHLKGKAIRDVLAKGSPADLRPSALPVGELRRSRLGQLAVAYWFAAEDEAYLICFRSVANYIQTWFETVTNNDAAINYFK